jgi:hypothetical protein
MFEPSISAMILASLLMNFFNKELKIVAAI